MEELREALSPELELIESRIAGPAKELQAILKQIRKNMTKREHKVLEDSDNSCVTDQFIARGLWSIQQLFDKVAGQERKVSQWREEFVQGHLHLSLVAVHPLLGFQLEQDFEVASNDYETLNTAMKTELPRFFAHATQFIDPLFHSFYYMQ
jgi:amphiphysin